MNKVLEEITKDGWKDLEVKTTGLSIYAKGEQRLLFNGTSVVWMYDLSKKGFKYDKSIPREYQQ